MDPQTVGVLLRKIRFKRDLTLEVVTGLAGISAGFLSQVERGLAPLERLSHWRGVAVASAAFGLAATLVFTGGFTLAKTVIGNNLRSREVLRELLTRTTDNEQLQQLANRASLDQR